MTGPSPTDLVFTPSVKAVQERLGSRQSYASWETRGGGMSAEISVDLAEFVAARDSCYLATVTADGQPYIQHRGGPPGFLKVLDNRTLAFADYSGNRQYLSIGNLDDNPRAALFLMDYPNRRRVKIWGRAEVVEDDPELLEQLAPGDDYRARPERVFRITVDAWDVNCPQHITPRFTADEVAAREQALQDRIKALEAQVAELAQNRGNPPDTD